MTVEQALREALEWALAEGGWRLIYFGGAGGSSPIPLAIEVRPLGEHARINEAYLDSLR